MLHHRTILAIFNEIVKDYIINYLENSTWFLPFLTRQSVLTCAVGSAWWYFEHRTVPRDYSVSDLITLRGRKDHFKPDWCCRMGRLFTQSLLDLDAAKTQ